MINTKGSVKTTFLKKILLHIFNEVKRNSIQNQLWHRVIPVKRDVIIVKREGFYLCYMIFYIQIRINKYLKVRMETLYKEQNISEYVLKWRGMLNFALFLIWFTYTYLGICDKSVK